MTTQIIPAILPKTYDELAEKAGLVRGAAPVVQLDICDGVFVPSKTWPYSGSGIAEDQHFMALAKQDEGLPYWEELDYELDLMIAEPEKHLDEWLPLGASRIIVHIEAIKDIDKFFAHDFFKPGARHIGDPAGVTGGTSEPVVEFGLALNAGTPLVAIEPYLDRVDLVQCMGIAKIGFQGQPFDERVLTHINALRVAHPDLIISVDGGVSEDTAKLLVDAGADRLVVGSAIFSSPGVAHAIAELEKAAEGGTLSE